jgi:chromosome segregation ATPase
MFKLFKRLVVGGAIVVAVIAILGTSYGALSVKKCRAFFKKQISPETRVEMIRDEIAGLDKEMKQFKSAVADETVAVDNLREEIARAEDSHQKQLDKIKIMRKDLAACEENGEKTISYGNKAYSVDRVRNKLAHDWDDYKKTEEAIASQRELLKAREVSLTSVRERLDDLRGRKEGLEVQVAQLEADLKNVRLAQSRSDFHFDDSKVGEIQKEMAEVRDWIKARRVEAELEGKVSDDPIPVGKKNTSPVDLYKEIDSVLDKKPARSVDE